MPSSPARCCTAGRPAARSSCSRAAGARSTGRSPRCATRPAASTASLDADSEGVEGRYYVWTTAELHELLGADAQAAIAWFAASDAGNFADPHHPEPGLNVLQGTGPRPDAATLARIRGALLAARARRTRPARDEKCLTGWNALMIAALADAGAALAEPRYSAAANACAEFVEREPARQRRATAAGLEHRASRTVPAFLEDYALLLEALLVLFEASCEERWFQRANELAAEMVALSPTASSGGFFATGADAEALIARRKEIDDSPIPSGQSAAAAALSGSPSSQARANTSGSHWRRSARSRQIAPEYPTSFGYVLLAQHIYLAPAKPISCPVPPRGSTGSGRAPTA